MKKILVKYNFKPVNSSSKIYSYYDDDSIRVIHIFKSGWERYYHCVIEDPQYEESYHETCSPKQIEEKYGLKTFSRLEKLKKIYESTL